MNDLFNLEGNVALVTGAAKGLGLHFAKVLAENGAEVIVTARQEKALEGAVAEIAKSGGKVGGIAMDVTNPNSIIEAFVSVEENFGPVTVLVNNAGIAGGHSLLRTEEEDWDRVMDTNLKGAWLVAKEAAQRMIEMDIGGSIINVASIMGLRVAGGVGAYAASKAGLIHMTRAMALEWARYGIRVNALAPGYIETDMNGEFLKSESGQKLLARIPQRRFGKKRELNGPLLLLASDASSLMTGSVITADGGHLISSL
ncbi:MAG: glucose 1-dehydrogenase [Rhodospirillales bacterium]|nr:glucose 1-dehydrogenase [Rhodospirillales bacterium]